MDLRDSPADAAFREQVRDWLAEHLVGEFARHRGVGGPTDDEHWELRKQWEHELAAARLLNISWPREYGGRGGTVDQEIVFLQEHAAAAAPYWVGVQGRDLFGPTLLRHGTDTQKARFLPAITRVEQFWGQGFSEPGAGSDLAGMTTRAVRSTGGWTVNGQKVWSSGAHLSQVGILACRTGPAEDRHANLSVFALPMSSPGVLVRRVRIASPVLCLLRSAWIVRTSGLFGVTGTNFVRTMLRLGHERDEVAVVHDQRTAPTYVDPLAAATKELLDRPFGIWHLAAAGDCTWAEFTEAIFEEAGLDTRVRRISTDELGRPAPRPAYSVLRSEKDAPALPHWREGLRACLSRIA